MVKEYVTTVLSLKNLLRFFLQYVIKLLLSFYNVKLFLIISLCNIGNTI